MTSRTRMRVLTLWYSCCKVLTIDGVIQTSPEWHRRRRSGASRPWKAALAWLPPSLLLWHRHHPLPWLQWRRLPPVRPPGEHGRVETGYWHPCTSSGSERRPTGATWTRCGLPPSNTISSSSSNCCTSRQVTIGWFTSWQPTNLVIC